MRYIRTDTNVFEVINQNEKVFYVRAKGNPHNIYSKSKCNTQIIKSGDTIEELIQDNDILYIYDHENTVVLVLGGNIKPFKNGEPIKLKNWLDFDIYEYDLFMRFNNGNYMKVAVKEIDERLKLL